MFTTNICTFPVSCQENSPDLKKKTDVNFLHSFLLQIPILWQSSTLVLITEVELTRIFVHASRKSPLHSDQDFLVTPSNPMMWEHIQQTESIILNQSIDFEFTMKLRLPITIRHFLCWIKKMENKSTKMISW